MLGIWRSWSRRRAVMVGSEERVAGRSRPRVVVRVGTRPGRYRRKADLSAPDGVRGEVPSGARTVIVQVGSGLRAEDLAGSIEVARRLRGASVVEILGSTREAVERARMLFEDTWAADDQPEGSAARAAVWAAQFLAGGGGEGLVR